MGTSNNDLREGARNAVKRPLPGRRPRPQPPIREPRGVCPRCGGGGPLGEPCRQASCKEALFAETVKARRPSINDDPDKTVMVSAYREPAAVADAEATVMVSAMRDAPVGVSHMPTPNPGAARTPNGDQHDTGEEKTVCIPAMHPAEPAAQKAEAPRPKQARRPRPQSRRPRSHQEPECTVLLSIDDIPKTDTETKDVLTRRAPEHRRPGPARKFKPIESGYRPATQMRPAFEVDPADLARAASQKTLTPEDFDATSAALDSNKHPVTTGDMEIVSATSGRTDWMTSAQEESFALREPPAGSPHPEQRRRPAWLVPLLAVAAVAALVGTFFFALSGDSAPATPTVVMVPSPLVVIANVAADDQDKQDKATPPGSTAEPTAKRAVEKTTGQTNDQGATQDKKPAVTEPRSEPRPMWAQTNASLNPWVEVAGASTGTMLGLSVDQLDRSPSRLTGFPPETDFMAPTYDYRMQSHEVTWEELGKFIFASQLSTPEVPSWSPSDPEVRARMPATNVPWDLANAYCQAIGGALPSEAEWAWAARGEELHTHPWGEDLPYANRVRLRRGAPVLLSPVATMSQDVTPGSKPMHDLLGNAAEWTRDAWVPSDPDEDNHSIEGRDLRAVRGWPLGDPGDPLPAEGLTYRRAECAGGDCIATANLELVGFRCMMR